LTHPGQGVLDQELQDAHLPPCARGRTVDVLQSRAERGKTRRQ
jgi:hypothetical protein